MATLETLLCLMLCTVTAAKNDGLYVTNGTDILYFEDSFDENVQSVSTPVSLFHQPGGRIVGLTVDVEDNVIFWSDISSTTLGIYRARLDDGDPLQDVTAIVTSDIVEVNGVAVDWESNNIYWTDAKKRTIEVTNYNGEHRRVLGLTDLISPRGIVVDPITGYLFWTDQGRHSISRSRPDGSRQEVITSDNVYLPNQIVVQRSKLYWVDSQDKSVWTAKLDGSGKVRLGSVSDIVLSSNVFGLALDGDGGIYVGAWERGMVLSFSPDATPMSHALTPYRLGSAVFSMAYYSTNGTEAGANNPCNPASGKNGCSHLCLPTGASSARCACPSYGGLTVSPQGKNCHAPQHVLLFALGGDGSVQYTNPGNRYDPDRYLVGRSLRPVAIAYDPVEQIVYWSDVQEQRIHRAKLDGTQHTIFLDNEHAIGIVDGMVLDHKHRKLYYTNLGAVRAGGSSYTWHKIEAVDLDNKLIRTIVTDTEKPRALAVDPEAGYLYYTDWGSDGKIMRTLLDGSVLTVIQTGLDNPNGLTILNNQLLVVDSHHKTRQDASSPTNINGTVALTDSEGLSWQQWQLPSIKTPFGAASDERTGRVFISDWDSGSIVSMTMDRNGWSSPVPVVQGVKTPMGVISTVVSLKNVGLDPCTASRSPCEEMCFSAEGGLEAVCTCSSYNPNVLEQNQHTCGLPGEFVMFADMTSIKLVGLDTDDRTPYDVVRTSHLSNCIGLVYDPAEHGVYYSQLKTQERRGIYFSKLDGTISRTVYQGNSIIDGLALDPTQNLLYWSDVLAGTIVSMATSGDEDSYRVLVSGLSAPRAVRIDTANSYLYWTEIGESSRVARVPLGSDGDTTVQTLVRDVRQPNGLHMDIQEQKLYIGDGFYKKILVCDLEGNDCEDLSYVAGVAEHVYDVVKQGDTLYYSDWVRGTVTQVNLQTGTVSDLAEDLLRPTGIVLQYQDQTTCASDNQCSHDCVTTPDGYQCLCPVGQRLATDGFTCLQAGGQWQKAVADQCGSACGEHELCARQVGGATALYRCQCAPGYMLRTVGNSQACTACGVNQYKPDIGDNVPCAWCPQTGAQTPEGSIRCACRQGLFWNDRNNTCSGSKEGACPARVPVGLRCGSGQPQCATDRECPGAQKCCSPEPGCPTMHCMDPTLGPQQCAYDGVVYDLGNTFRPNACTRCECQRFTSSDQASVLCVIEECPVLPCNPDQQIQAPNECCPICKVPSGAKNLTIDNCPQGQLITLNVKRDSKWALHDFYIQPYDRSGLHRSITVEKFPSGNYYQWNQSREVDVMWRATAHGPSGMMESVLCSYKVKVIDPYPPELECPEDIVAYTVAGSMRVQWVPPVATDNVGMKTGFPKVTSGQQWGSDFMIGSHGITYTAEDLASNQQMCSFQILVRPLQPISARCSIQSPTHGQLSCYDAGLGTVSCTLQCAEGFVRPPGLEEVYQFDCTGGIWNPPLSANFMVDSCVKIVPRTMHLSSTLVYPDCLEGLNVMNAELDLHDQVMKKVLGRTADLGRDFQLDVHVDSWCTESNRPSDAPKKDDYWLRVVVSLTELIEFPAVEGGPCTNNNTLTAVLQDILHAIEYSDVALVRPQSMVSHLYDIPLRPVVDSHLISSSPFQVNSGCAAGQEPRPEQCGSCLVCPPGMYKGHTKCQPCGPGSYQSLPGQTFCINCPHDNHTTETLAYTDKMCGAGCTGADCEATTKTLPAVKGRGGISVMILGIIIAAAVVVIVIIIVVTVVFVRRSRKRHAKPEDEAPTNSFTNPMFGDRPYAVSGIASGPTTNNNKPAKGKRGADKGSVRSNLSTSSAMARAYPDMPEKEVEVAIDDRGKVDLLKDLYM